jgi:hypothetical protein
MTLFDDRERAFEQMFAHDEEARFRALARRNKLLGQWAADKLGLGPQDAAAYVDEVRGSVVAAVVDEGLVRKIGEDFDARGIAVSDEDIRQKMAELMARASEEVRAGEWKTLT